MADKTGNRLVKYVPDYVVFDLETTGTSYKSDSIIEIAAVKVKGGHTVHTFSTLVNPQCGIPFQATQVNGITDGMVADAPLIKEALSGFLEFIGDFVLVGHNIQSFDLKFIYRDAAGVLGADVPNDFIDTLFMARACLPSLSHHRLTDLAAYFNLDASGAHRALNDCMINKECYEEMAKLQEGLVMDICPSCGGGLKKRNGKFGEFFGCSNYPKCRYTRNIQR